MTEGINKVTVCVSEVTDKGTGKKYVAHAYITTANPGTPQEKVYADYYITDSDPHHDVLVGFGRMDVSPEKIKKLKANQAEVSVIFSDRLDYGIRRFEAVMAHGIKGNELQ